MRRTCLRVDVALGDGAEVVRSQNVQEVAVIESGKLEKIGLVPRVLALNTET